MGMKPGRIWGIYFSATGTTRLVVRYLANSLAAGLSLPRIEFDFTRPEARRSVPSPGRGDLAIFGMPVYAGRVPNLLLPYIREIHGGGAAVVPVVLYGNRSFDDGLRELQGILEENGFHTVAAAAFIGEHAFSDTLAQGRPNVHDLAQADRLVEALIRRYSGIDTNEPPHRIEVEGQFPPRPYYQPRDLQGNPIDIRKVKPKTDTACTHCGLCAPLCPMGAIDARNTDIISGVCIKCCACVKGCPAGAKYFDDPGFLWHLHDLEETYGHFKRSVQLFL